MSLSAAHRRFLDRPLVARLSSLDPDGYPHTVPVWITRDADDLVVTTFRATQKVRNLERDGRCAVSIGGDPYRSEGYLFRGVAALEPDPDRTMTASIIRRYEDPTQAESDLVEWSRGDIVLLRIRVGSVIAV